MNADADNDRLLLEATHELMEISRQWEEMGLAADFFTLPYELRELVGRLLDYCSDAASI